MQEENEKSMVTHSYNGKLCISRYVGGQDDVQVET